MEIMEKNNSVTVVASKMVSYAHCKGFTGHEQADAHEFLLTLLNDVFNEADDGLVKIQEIFEGTMTVETYDDNNVMIGTMPTETFRDIQLDVQEKGNREL